ncbi:Lrp/AsnC family transcriptional regulator [Streptomyces sp. NPDC007088]|uniref:Lrp/AsnC family transcriptional regulator n=1 Tax=Streptomyces sp. NPDC007088 TaxID=3364773 RepID=UPI003695ADF0
MLDELDYVLVTALQHAPRADWRRIGQAVGVDATTAARRWARLTDAGLAWLSCYPSPWAMPRLLVAYIEVDCVPGRAHELCARLVDDSPLFNIERTTGARDLVLTAVFRDRAELSRYLDFRLGGLPGVVRLRTQLATTLHVEGSQWRLDRLPAERRALLAPVPHEPREPARTVLGDPDLALVLALGADCRQSAAALAARTGSSPTTVRRRLERLAAAGAITFRCELAHSVSGWPVSATLWCAVPAADTARVTAALSGLRETRQCATLSGPHNLMLTAWLRSMDDIQPFEVSLGRRHPELRVDDRAVTLWQPKHAGHVLSPDGRRLRWVPFTPEWTDPGAEAAEQAAVARLRG